jgi:hypothetical protein
MKALLVMKALLLVMKALLRMRRLRVTAHTVSAVLRLRRDG